MLQQKCNENRYRNIEYAKQKNKHNTYIYIYIYFFDGIFCLFVCFFEGLILFSYKNRGSLVRLHQRSGDGIRTHRVEKRMKKAHSVLHCSSSHNPHGQIFSFPPGSLPIQRISPLLTTFHCPDERTYPSPTNNMATNWTSTHVTIKINATKNVTVKKRSFF